MRTAGSISRCCAMLQPPGPTCDVDRGLAGEHGVRERPRPGREGRPLVGGARQLRARRAVPGDARDRPVADHGRELRAAGQRRDLRGGLGRGLLRLGRCDGGGEHPPILSARACSVNADMKSWSPMRRRAALLTVLATLAGGAASAEAKQLTRYDVGGGIAGRVDHLVITTGGTATQTGSSGDHTFRLSTRSLHALKRDLRDARFSSLKRSYKPPRPGVRRHRPERPLPRQDGLRLLGRAVPAAPGPRARAARADHAQLAVDSARRRSTHV